MNPPRFGVLLSGTGRTLANFLDRIEDGRFNGEIAAVVSSVPDAGGLEIARNAGIPAITVQRRNYENDLEFSNAIYEEVEGYSPDLLLLCGFLRRLVVPSRWESRILNIHPALLPEMSFAAGRGMYGDRVHAAVLDHGSTRTGASVHVVENVYDSGDVVATAEIDVIPTDTVKDLASRVFEVECDLYPRAVTEYLKTHPQLIREK